MSKKIFQIDTSLFVNIKSLIEQSKSFIVQNVNTTLVFTNFHIGRMIVKDEQQGKERAVYAEKTLKNLSKKLTKEFGKGYSEDNLNRMRAFFLLYQNRISASVMRKFITTDEKNASVMRKSLIAKFEKAEPESVQSPFAKFTERFKLSWTHYIFLMKINNDEERNFYEIETANNY